MISKEGERAMEACADKAEQMTEFSTEAGRNMVLKFLEEKGPQTGETLVWWCKGAGLVPHDDRAFGAVFQVLSRQQRIKKIGYGPRHKGHGTSGAIVWALNQTGESI